MAPLCKTHFLKIKDVWANNFEEEFNALVSMVRGSFSGTIIGCDVEFPGFFREEAPWSTNREAQYQTLRANVDLMTPIQIGVAVASVDGTILSAWNFNLKFDVDNDLHTESALILLKKAGINFGHHARIGIAASLFGQRLAGSFLVGNHWSAPLWVTLSGEYDFGYLMKVVTEQQLPSDKEAFQRQLDLWCPRRHELRDRLPYGSLDTLAFQHGVVRRGAAHTGGSDALTTLELYLGLLPIVDPVIPESQSLDPLCVQCCHSVSFPPPLGLSMPPPPGLCLPSPPGLSMPPPPGLCPPPSPSLSTPPAPSLSLPRMSGLSTGTESGAHGRSCDNGSISFPRCDHVVAHTGADDWRSDSRHEFGNDSVIWSEDWRTLGSCESRASRISWGHHARQAMSDGQQDWLHTVFVA